MQRYKQEEKNYLKRYQILLQEIKDDPQIPVEIRKYIPNHECLNANPVLGYVINDNDSFDTLDRSKKKEYIDCYQLIKTNENEGNNKQENISQETGSLSLCRVTTNFVLLNIALTAGLTMLYKFGKTNLATTIAVPIVFFVASVVIGITSMIIAENYQDISGISLPDTITSATMANYFPLLPITLLGDWLFNKAKECCCNPPTNKLDDPTTGKEKQKPLTA